MKVVIDSNVLLVAVGKRSRFRPIWQAFMNGDYQIVISEEIIHEYEEILNEHSAPGSCGISNGNTIHITRRNIQTNILCLEYDKIRSR